MSKNNYALLIMLLFIISACSNSSSIIDNGTTPKTQTKYPEYVRGFFNDYEVNLDKKSTVVSIIKGSKKFKEKGIEYEAEELDYLLHIYLDNNYVIRINMQNPQVTQDFSLVEFPGNTIETNTISIYNTKNKTGYTAKEANLKINKSIQLDRNVIVGGYYYDITLNAHFTSNEYEDIFIKDLNILFYYSIEE